VQKPTANPIVLALIDNLIWVLVLAALITFSVLSKSFITPYNLVNIIPKVAAIGLLVIGQSFTMITAHFDLSSESGLGVTAMVAGLLIATTQYGGLGVMAPAWLAIIAMIAVGLLIGLANGLMITRLRMNNLIVTIAMMIALRGVVYIISPGSSASFFGPVFNWLGGGTLFRFQSGAQIVSVPVSLAFVLLAFAVSHIITQYTQFGRNMYAVGASRDAAESSGIRSQRIILYVYLISGLCAALAGLLSAGRLDSATPRSGLGWIFPVQAAAIIGGISLSGGRGNMIGALGGLLLWGILDTGLSILQVNPFTIDVFRGGLLLFAVLLDALKTRYLYRTAMREALSTTSIGLADTSLGFK